MLSANGRRTWGAPSGRTVKTVKNSYFTIKAGDQNNIGRKLTVVISVAAVKAAVRRNFLRRQIRNILKDFVNTHPGVVVIVRPEIAALTKKKIKQEFSLALQKIT